jgi:hypothetical protein
VADASLLGKIIDIQCWLREDRDNPFALRVTRDREIGRHLTARQDVERLIEWWEKINPQPPPTAGRKTVTLRRYACVVLFAVGLVTGGVVCRATFAYDGDYPVNLFVLLGVLVGLPLFLLGLTLLALPGRVPGVSALREAFAALSLSRWMGVWLDRAASVSVFSGFERPPGDAAFARWQMLTFAQWLGVGFFLGVLGVAWLLVAVTDLAFGWSTTLRMEPSSVHRIFALLALPWSGWLPGAVPDLELVEASRYHRLAAGPAAVPDASYLGNWWRFVLMAIAVYGLAPRLSLLLIGYAGLNRATRQALREDSDVTALLDRLSSPSVSFDNPGEDTVDPEEAELQAPPPFAAARTTAAGAIAAVIWNDAIPGTTARTWLREAAGTAEPAVAALSVLMDSARWRTELESFPRDVRQLVIFTKGWEPPLLEFNDFVLFLRELVGSEVSLTVVPVGLSGTAVEVADRRIWARSLARLGDPRLYVADATGVAS